MTRPATRLSLIFFLSGAAALLFETLWFRLCGLTFGNTAWASTLVLTSFMTGLAAGNLLAVRIAHKRDALPLYAAIEAGIALTGVLLVLLLPSTQDLFAPLFRALLGSDFALNAARLVLAFILLCVPTTLMGATLPTVIGALSRSERNYGRALGLLYGWNTMGAVAGSIAGELVLIKAFGVRGTGIVAAGLSGAAALTAWTARLDGAPASAGTKVPAEGGAPLGTARFLLAAALSGFSLLALEVIWFRFVELFIFATSLAFAVMLAVVLLGIAIGALAASMILRKSTDADQWAATIAAISGAMVIASYAGFDPQLLSRGTFAPGVEQRAVLVDALRLMLPVSVLSGLLFTLVGRSVERELRDETRAAAALTAFNTIGAAVGSGIAGFLLIPLIGIERGFFAIAIVYAAVALLLVPRDGRARIGAAVAGAILLVALVLFPFGRFRSTFIPLAARDYVASAEIAAVREGPIETAVYLRTSVAGRPYMYRLFTNGYSMAATSFSSKRYMSMFTWVPLALRPQAKTAVLISFGVGVTARSLANSPQLQSIDVVDISHNILDLADLVWPDASNPLRDPRMHKHVEDGRFFLRTTNRRFDLITSEPPPPKSAGVVSLYTEEYFRLVKERLSDDGIASYWLPVYQLSVNDARSIVSAFCNAFDDCSLWSGAGTEWMLIGSRRGTMPLTEAGFSRQFQERAAGDWLRWIGVETPELLAATFLTDADGLRRFTAGTPPLTDDRPLRLSTIITGGILPEYLEMHARAPQEFARSAFIRRTIPESVRQRAMSVYAIERVIDGRFNDQSDRIDPRTLSAILTQTQLRMLPRIIMRTDMWLENIARDAVARGSHDPQLIYIVGAGELAERRYARAAQLFQQAADGGLTGARPFAGLASELAGEQNRSR
ncbi:MAG TPA: spermidine synthase [Thermoanaerobaculia bacterium]|nr:spermidine synthase [Thermoanaerobaculia bacterium]